MTNINLWALDENYDIVTVLTYFNLQWNRKYHESGSFSVQIPVEQYDASFKYLYSKDRREVGEISQVNYTYKNGTATIVLSGMFLEDELNRRVVYEYGTGNITNAPTWTSQSGKAETVAYTYFNAFKDVTFAGYSSLLGISAATDAQRGHEADHQREGEYLGDKIYKILKPSKMSYRVNFDYVNKTKQFEVWQGVDRTSDNEELNNPVVFSTKYGNINNIDIVVAETSYKNCYISMGKLENAAKYIVAGQERALDDNADNYTYISARASYNDYNNVTTFANALKVEGHEKLLETTRTINVEFDALTGSYEYMTDFNLGDLCSLEIPEAGISADVLLIGVYEVIKSGTHTISLEFGTPLLK